MWGYYKNYFVIGFFLFLFYGILRSIFSEFPWYSLSEGGSLFYFRYLFFVLGVSYLLKSNPKLLNKFMLIVFLCLLTVSLDGIYQYLFGQNLLGIGPAENQRISGVFGEEAVLGRYISYFTVIYIFMFFSSDLKKIQKIFIIFFLPFLIGTVFLSGDRAPFLKLVIVLSLFAIFIKNYRFLYLGTLLITFLVSITILFTMPNVKSRFIDDSLSWIKKNEISIAPYGRDYEEIFITSIKIGNLNPIFGKGPNAFKIYCSSSNEIESLTENCSHPHNFFLQLYSELGIIGLFFLLSFYFYLLKLMGTYSIKNFNNKILDSEPFYKIGIIVAIVIFLLPILPNMNFYNNWNNVFLFLILALFFNNYQDKMKIKNET